jgi:hypothetical protein
LNRERRTTNLEPNVEPGTLNPEPNVEHELRT